MSSKLMQLRDKIKQKALNLGFDLVGITDCSPVESRHASLFLEWLDAGCEADMTWMQNNIEKRLDPAKLLEGAKSVIVAALSYKPPEFPSPPAPGPAGRVAHYAQFDDYHPFIKKLLGKLAEFILEIAGPGLKFKICCDSAPVLERALAERAGLGFIGKNHMLINPGLGPELFLGELLTNLELVPDKPIKSSCGDCNKCLNACPMGALRPDGLFDAGRCISYLTIEHKGQIAPELTEKIGDRLFGCDRCVLACPYQRRAAATANPLLKFHPEQATLDLNHVLQLSENDFEACFSGSPLYRTGLQRLKRNAAVCLENARQDVSQ